ncbi:MAG: PAS domain S-box protein [Chlorobi bacterium]|nr:PAS domain S-box protein [Chlorobiota bacterium]
MINPYIFLGYAVINLLIAIILYVKLSKSFISQFYIIAVIYLITFGGLGSLYGYIEVSSVRNIIVQIILLIYSFFPFIFLHFIINFVGYNKMLSNRRIVNALYFTGLVSYLSILFNLIPSPFYDEMSVRMSGSTFYITWMSIFFALGIAQLYSIFGGYSEKGIRSKILFTGFVVLLLFLPGPFSESLFKTLLGDYSKWYYISSLFSLIGAIYIVFRHKTSVHFLEALRSSLELLQDVLIKTDENFKIEFAEGGVRPLLAVEPKQLVGKNLNEIFTDENFLEKYKNFIVNENQSKGLFDARVVIEDGNEVLMNFSISPIVEADTIAGYLLIGRDITDRKRIEEELRLANEELELRVQERTAKLAEVNRLLQLDIEDRKRKEAQLKKLTEELKQTVASKDKMFSIVAHDLRNPFVTLLGFSEILVQEIDGLSKSDAKQFAQNIYNSSKRVYHLLENLLQWARIQTDRIEYTPVTFKISKILQNVLILYEDSILRKKIRVTKHIKCDKPIFADQNMIETVLRNLVSNAIKFTNENGAITFESECDGNFMKISVADNGMGIRKEDMEKLFRIDSIVSLPDTEKRKGSGLGLILSKEFIEKNSGRFWLESEINVGTAFHFTVPLDKNQTQLGNS